MKEFAHLLVEIFGLNRKTYLFAVDFGAAITMLLAGVVGLVKPHINYLLLIVFVVLADFATGAWLAQRRGKFETRKAIKLVYKLTAYILIFVMARLCVKAEPTLLAWLPEAVLIPTVLLTVASVLKNLSLLGLIPLGVASALWKHIDVYKEQGGEPEKEPEPPENKEQKQY